MKKVLILLLSATALLSASSPAYNALRGSVEDALINGKFSANLKLFYMSRLYDGSQTDAKAFNAGGILKYESGGFHRFKFGLAYYGSHRLGGIYSKEQGIGTFMLQKKGEDIHFLGEAYLQYRFGKTLLKTGRQQLVTPILKKIEERLLPTVYEATILKNRDIPKTMIEAGHVTGFSGFGSRISGFDANKRLWGDRGLGFLYVKYTGIKDITLWAQYVKALSDTNGRGKKIKKKDYRYFGFKYVFPSKVHGYIKAQYLQNSYYEESDAKAIRIKVVTLIAPKLKGIFEYDTIKGNNIWPWYGRLEPSTGLTGALLFGPFKGFRLKIGYNHVRSSTQKRIDDFTEYTIKLHHKINSWSTFKMIVNIRDQSNASEKLFSQGKGGREDRNDIRVIYSLTF